MNAPGNYKALIKAYEYAALKVTSEHGLLT